MFKNAVATTAAKYIPRKTCKSREQLPYITRELIDEAHQEKRPDLQKVKANETEFRVLSSGLPEYWQKTMRHQEGNPEETKTSIWEL